MDKFIKRLLKRNIHPQHRLTIDQFIKEFCDECEITVELTETQREIISGSDKWININKIELFGINNYADLIAETDKKWICKHGESIYVAGEVFKFFVARYNQYVIRYMILLIRISHYYGRYRYECDLLYNEDCAKSFIWEMRKLHLDQMASMIKKHTEDLSEKNKTISELKAELAKK
jgi:hypothetical protein